MAVAVLMSVLIAGLHLGAAILARHRAESAADLAALAAARQAVRGEAAACRHATEIAAATGASVSRCLLVGWDALVEVRVPVAMALPGLDVAVGQAMAGPESAPPTTAAPTPATPTAAAPTAAPPITAAPRAAAHTAAAPSPAAPAATPHTAAASEQQELRTEETAWGP